MISRQGYLGQRQTARHSETQYQTLPLRCLRAFCASLNKINPALLLRD